MVMIGDVVEVRQIPGDLWAVLAPVDHAIPPGRIWCLRGMKRLGGACPPGRHAGDDDIIWVAHPTFEAGQTVSYDASADGNAEVITDNGDTLCIRYQRLRPRNLDRQLGRYWRVRTPQICESNVERGNLVAENL